MFWCFTAASGGGLVCGRVPWSVEVSVARATFGLSLGPDRAGLAHQTSVSDARRSHFGWHLENGGRRRSDQLVLLLSLPKRQPSAEQGTKIDTRKSRRRLASLGLCSLSPSYLADLFIQGSRPSSGSVRICAAVARSNSVYKDIYLKKKQS